MLPVWLQGGIGLKGEQGNTISNEDRNLKGLKPQRFCTMVLAFVNTQTAPALSPLFPHQLGLSSFDMIWANLMLTIAKNRNKTSCKSLGSFSPDKYQAPTFFLCSSWHGGMRQAWKRWVSAGVRVPSDCLLPNKHWLHGLIYIWQRVGVLNILNSYDWNEYVVMESSNSSVLAPKVK